MKNDIRSIIIKVAQETFRRYGFRKTTMDEIAYAARKGKSSLYYYFKSKEDVFEAVVEKEINFLHQDIIDAVGKAETAKEKINIYIYKRMNGLKNLGNFYEALKDEYLSNMEFIEKIRKKYDEQEMDILSKIIGEGIERNEFKMMDATLTAKIIVIAMKGLEVPLMMENEKSDIKTRIIEVLDILFYGMCR